MILQNRTIVNTYTKTDLKNLEKIFNYPIDKLALVCYNFSVNERL